MIFEDPLFAPPSTLPFPAGASPFRQKGNAYIVDRPWLDESVRGGFAAAVAAIPDAPVRAFLNQRFKASEWYDAYPGAVLEATAARLRGVAFSRHRRESGAYHARHAMRGIYASLLKVISNDNVALWCPRIASMYFDFGKMTTREAGAKSVIATRSGVPAGLVQWSGYAMMAFVESALEIAGARGVRCAVSDVVESDRAFGQATYRMDFTATWG